jgi:xylose isomerase
VKPVSEYVPSPADRFTFGLWTVGNVGRDPFGLPTRRALDPVETVHKLAELGAAGVNLHDEDLVPFGSSPSQQRQIVSRFRTALDESGIRVTMATTNLFSQPIFKDGAFTANDPGVRRFALRKTLDAIDLGVELGAETYVFWGGREGSEVLAAKPPRDAFERYREALDFICAYVLDQGYHLRLALEPKPNEPRGDSFVATVGHALALIDRLEHPEIVGLNPEFAHETMTGLSFAQAVGLALWAGKLFHIDLNSQRVGRFDQDLRFGQEDLKESFLLVRLLESSGYDGPRHFDAHALRVEDTEGVWEFARGCMRTYLILAEKARAFDADPRVVDALATAGAPALGTPTVAGGYSAESLRALREESFDVDALAARGYANERLDQLVVEHLLGV